MPGWRIFKIFRAFLMLADIILEFFVAFTKSQSEKMSNNDNFMDQKLRKKERQGQ